MDLMGMSSNDQPDPNQLSLEFFISGLITVKGGDRDGFSFVMGCYLMQRFADRRISTFLLHMMMFGWSERIRAIGFPGVMRKVEGDESIRKRWEWFIWRYNKNLWTKLGIRISNLKFYDLGFFFSFFLLLWFDDLMIWSRASNLQWGMLFRPWIWR